MEVTINAVSNLVITIAGIFFMIFVFRSQKIDDLPLIEKYFLKIALAILISGSLFNFLTLSTPHFTEVLLNVGLALVLLWGAWFHYKNFEQKD